MSKKFLFLLSATLFIMSCDKTVNTSKDSISTITKPESKSITVNEAGYEFSLNWPNELTKQGLHPEIKYNETSGVLEITSGDKIQIEVTDEAISLTEIKKELDDNQMFTYKFYDETPDGYVFQAVLPDGTSYFYNFLEQKTIGGKTYLFKNRDNEEFTLRDIKTMKEIAASVK